MSRSEQLLQVLCDGRFHSGESLARALGCSRSAIWKQIAALRARMGLEIQAVRGRGYRLTHALELLDPATIVQHISSPCRSRLRRLQIDRIVDSTNAEAMAALAQGADQPMAWLAEHQRKGRGRRGRRWYSPFGRNLYLSLLYPFDLPMSRLSGLSIVMGTAVAELLADHGLTGHGIKWPNDIYLRNAKLGGLLIEMRAEVGGPVQVVIGVGLNLDLGGQVPAWIGQSTVDLRQTGLKVSRNALAGRLIDALMRSCHAFVAEGAAGGLERFQTWDLCRGREVCVELGERQLIGVAEGVDETGGLRVRTDRGVQVFHGGEVSLRLGTDHG